MTEGTGFSQKIQRLQSFKSLYPSMRMLRGSWIHLKQCECSRELCLPGLWKQKTHQSSSEQQGWHQQDGDSTVCVHQPSKDQVTHDGCHSAHACEETKSRGPERKMKRKEIQYMCMWPLWVRIKHLDGWVNRLKKIQKRNLSLIYIFIHGWIWVSRPVTVALSGRAQFLRHPAHSRQSRTPRWRRRTGSDSELWSEPHRWRRHSDWTTTGCRLEKVTKRERFICQALT